MANQGDIHQEREAENASFMSAHCHHPSKKITNNLFTDHPAHM
jgi:hypothetical protein